MIITVHLEWVLQTYFRLSQFIGFLEGRQPNVPRSSDDSFDLKTKTDIVNLETIGFHQNIVLLGIDTWTATIFLKSELDS